jgi:TRAP-type mannitol/chloroaromatic compound transport system permease small subunit
MTAAGVASAIDKLNRSVGRITAWLTLAMVLVTFCVVVLRYLFDTGWIWLQESVTWMHAAVFMLAAAYTLADDQHVRVDIFYREMSEPGRALVNALGTALFLLPLSVFLIWSSWDYASLSWEIHETSREAGGMIFPFPSIMKSFIPATAFLLLLQGIAMEARNISILIAAKHFEQSTNRR